VSQGERVITEVDSEALSSGAQSQRVAAKRRAEKKKKKWEGGGDRIGINVRKEGEDREMLHIKVGGCVTDAGSWKCLGILNSKE